MLRMDVQFAIIFIEMGFLLAPYCSSTMCKIYGQCCGSGIRDWVPFWPLDPGSGMGRKSASGSGMNNPDHIFKSLETILLIFLGSKYLISLWGSGILDGDISDPGSGMDKIRIRDKHPGSATLFMACIPGPVPELPFRPPCTQLI